MHDGAIDMAGRMTGGDPLLLDMSDFFKARPVEDGTDRFVFIEPSLPAWDQEKEKILKSALVDSKDHFIAKGNLDIEHLTAIGHRLPHIKNPYEWEVGTPVEVRDTPDGIFVKGRIAHDDGGKADWFWHTLTKRTPIMKWFPSVYGEPKETRRVFHAPANEHRTIITKALWRGIGFAKEPMNLAVPAIRVTPFGAFAKAMIAAEALPTCVGDHCACTIAKTVTTGMGTPAGGPDVSQLQGGAALRTQSIDGGVSDLTRSWQSRAAKYVRGAGSDACEHTRGRSFERATMHDHFQRCEGMSSDEAARVTDHLQRRLRDRLDMAA